MTNDLRDSQIADVDATPSELPKPQLFWKIVPPVRSAPTDIQDHSGNGFVGRLTKGVIGGRCVTDGGSLSGRVLPSGETQSYALESRKHLPKSPGIQSYSITAWVSFNKTSKDFRLRLGTAELTVTPWTKSGNYGVTISYSVHEHDPLANITTIPTGESATFFLAVTVLEDKKSCLYFGAEGAFDKKAFDCPGIPHEAVSLSIGGDAPFSHIRVYDEELSENQLTAIQAQDQDDDYFGRFVRIGSKEISLQHDVTRRVSLWEPYPQQPDNGVYQYVLGQWQQPVTHEDLRRSEVWAKPSTFIFRRKPVDQNQLSSFWTDIEDAKCFIKSFESSPSDELHFARLVWWENSDKFHKVNGTWSGADKSKQAVLPKCTFVAGRMSLICEADIPLQYDDQRLTAKRQPGQPFITLEYFPASSWNGNEFVGPATRAFPIDALTIPLSGPDAGKLQFKASFYQDELQGEFGCEQRACVSTTETPDTVDVITYPFLEEAPLEDYDDTEHVLAFDVSWDPLDPEQTRFSFDISQLNTTIDDPVTGETFHVNDLSIPFFSSVAGESIPLVPDEATPGGFSFAKSKLVVRYNGEGNGTLPEVVDQDDWYLTPSGAYKIDPSHFSDKVTSVEVMAGTAGTESFRATAETRFHFRTGAEARVNGLDVSGTTLDAELSDSSTSSSCTVTDAVYQVQPAAAVEYHVDSDTTHPPARYCLGVPAAAVVPLKAYRGLYIPQRTHRWQSPLAAVVPNHQEPDVFAALEQQIWAPRRWRKLVEEFLTRDGAPCSADSTGHPYPGGAVRTVLGFVSDLSSHHPGVWDQLVLAQGPVHPNQTLSIGEVGSAEGLTRQFSYALSDANLFLVATSSKDLGTFANELTLGDFPFEVDLGKDDAVLIFKSVAGISVKELVAQPALWTNARMPQAGGVPFLADGDTLDHVQARLTAAIDQADNGGEQFAPFRSLVTDPDWTGFLVVDCGINQEELPTDIQLLLGGISGGLRAHHLGVTANRVDSSTSPPTVDHSSIFALIHYQNGNYPKDPFEASGKNTLDFRVMILEARFANSKLVFFECEIAVKIAKLFGNPVKMTSTVSGDFPSTETMAIRGRYIKQENGTGRLLFDTKQPRVFEVTTEKNSHSRILTKMTVNDATLVPLHRTVDGTTTAVVSAFKISGLLHFATPWPSNDYDIFSYGDDTASGLYIENYSIQMTTTVPETGQSSLNYPFDTDLANVRIDDARSTARKDSLVAGLPVKPAALRFYANGLRTGRRGMWPVIIDNTSPADDAPTYVLELDLQIGAPGALSAHSGDMNTHLLLGWSAGGSDAADTPGVYLQFPAATATSRGFVVQGVVESSFSSVHLTVPKINHSPSNLQDTATTPTLKNMYAIRLADYQSRTLHIPMGDHDQGSRDLTFFGPPARASDETGSPAKGNAVWHLSVNPPESTGTLMGAAEKKSSKKKKKKKTQWYVGKATSIHTDPYSATVIDKALKKLFKHQLPLEEMIKEVADAALYDSAAGLTFGLEISFPRSSDKKKKKKSSKKKTLSLSSESEHPSSMALLRKKKPAARKSSKVTVSVLLQDDDFYGGKIQVKPAKGSALAKKFKDLELEVVYRKINNNLGEYSADLYLNVGKIPLGNVQLELPSVALMIWTNGDWRLAIGWPMKKHPMIIYAQVGEFPVVAKAGMYLAKLSTASAPKPFRAAGVPHYDLIWAFGLGLQVGLGKSYTKGPLKANVSLTAGGTFQGYLCSKDGQITKDGVDYYWFAITVSVNLTIKASLHVPLISASMNLAATIGAKLALETGHSMHMKLYATVTFRLKVKIVFVTIHIDFSAKLTLVDKNFGTGPAAKFSGPNPANAVGFLALADQMALQSVKATEVSAEVESLTKQNFKLKFVLNTTFTTDGTGWQACGVAMLLISLEQNSDLQVLANQLAIWLVNKYGGGTGSLKDQWENVENALAGTTALDNSDVTSFLKESCAFEVSGVDMSTDPKLSDNYGVFPFVDELTLTYNGNKQTSPTAQPGYLKAVNKAFDEHASGRTLTSPTTVRQIVRDEYFLSFGRQLVQELKPYLGQHTKISSVVTTWADSENKKAVSQLGGFLSRFLLGGARLPKPTTTTEDEAIYVLTGQQFPLVEAPAKPEDANSKPATEVVLKATISTTDSTATFKVGSGSGTATLSSDQIPGGTAGVPSGWKPDLTMPAPSSLGPLVQVPQVLSLTHGSTWTTAQGQQTKRLFRFTREVRHLFEDRLAKDEPSYLKLGLLPDHSDETALDLFSASTPLTGWNATPVTLLPMTLRQVPKPGHPGKFLPQVYELVGLDEEHQATLQALLQACQISLDSDNLTLNLTLLAPDGSGGLQTTDATPLVLIKTDLSAPTVPSHWGPDYASWQSQTDTDHSLLRLLWECGITHSHGFYVYFDANHDLSPSSFTAGEALMELLIEQSGKPNSVIEISKYTNAVVGGEPPKSHGHHQGVVAGLCSDSKGTNPVEIWQPVYPGGEVAWTMTRDIPKDETADASDPQKFVNDLYHLARYEVSDVQDQPANVKTYWSRPVTPRVVGTKWQYEHRIAAQDVLTKCPNRYELQGKAITVNVVMGDVYGNTLPSEDQGTVSLTPQFHDELVGVAHWPGVQTSYEVKPVMTHKNVTGATLDIRFDVDSTIESWKKNECSDILPHWQLISDQLNTPHKAVTVAVTSTLVPDTPDIAIGASLSSFAKGMVKYLNHRSAGTVATAPASITHSSQLDRSKVTTWSNDLQRLDVVLTISRSGVSDEIKGQLPSASEVSTPLKPYMNPGTTNDGTQSSLRRFAANFEQAYYNYDGEGGRLKIASGVDTEMTSDTFGLPVVWATRWKDKTNKKDKNVISISSDGTGQYFVPPPLSTTLISGAADVFDYESFPPPDSVKTTKVFTDIALDTWGQMFLASLEQLFSPELAPEIQQQTDAKPNLYTTASHVHRSVAENAARKAESLYEDGAAGQPKGNAVSARSALQQAMLRNLKNDYSTNVVAQFPVEVEIGATSEETPSPDFYGAIGAGGSVPSHAYSFSPADLPLSTGLHWLTTLISARTPEDSRFLETTPKYQIGFLEHAFQSQHEKYGFTPSSWLSFVLQKDLYPSNPTTETLDVSLDPQKIPIPLRSFPPMPKLKSQSGMQAYEPAAIKRISEALLWDYSVTAGMPMASQDTLVLAVDFNTELSSSDDTALMELSEPAAETLFEALAAYVTEAPKLEEHLKTGDKYFSFAVDRMNVLAGNVATAWKNWEPVPVPPSPEGAWTWRLNASESGSDLQLTFATSSPNAPDASVWPEVTIGGKKFTQDKHATRNAQKSGWCQTYCGPSTPPAEVAGEDVKLKWSNLFVLDRQDALTSAWVERDANLSTDSRTVNSNFVYRTPVLKFKSPVVPLIVAEPATPLSIPAGTSLISTLATTLNDLRTPPGEAVHSLPKMSLELGVGYRQALAAMPADNPEHWLTTERPLFLAEEQVAAGSSSAGTTAEKLGREITSQHQTMNQDVELPLSATMFATLINKGNEPLPLVRIMNIVMQTDDEPNWWVSPQDRL